MFVKLAYYGNRKLNQKHNSLFSLINPKTKSVSIKLLASSKFDSFIVQQERFTFEATAMFDMGLTTNK